MSIISNQIPVIVAGLLYWVTYQPIILVMGILVSIFLCINEYYQDKAKLSNTDKITERSGSQ